MPEAPEASPWLTRKRAAAYLDLTEDTLAQMAHRGTGPRFSKPSGRLVRYHRDELDQWLMNFSRTSSKASA